MPETAFRTGIDARAGTSPKSPISQPKLQDASTRKQKLVYPFWFGGSASSIATIFTHPLDLVKVRLQTRAPDGPKGMLGMFVHVAKTNGVVGLYSGLSAALMRQLTYSTTRFGVYEKLKEVTTSPGVTPSIWQLIAMSSASGFLGGLVGNPADVINVRMQHDAALPEAKRRNYKHALDGAVRMVREEGWHSLFRGVWPNSMRGVLMTSSQLTSYDSIKSSLMTYLGMKDNLNTHFSASFLAGFIATTICSPVDVIKTKVMSAHGSEGVLTLLKKTYQAEGPLWMFRGWVPSFIRLGPQTIFTFLALEQHKTIYRSLMGKEEER